MQVLRDTGSNQFEAWAETGPMTNLGGGLFGFAGNYEDPTENPWLINYEFQYDTGQTSSGGPLHLFLDFGLVNNTGGTETFTVFAGVPILQALAATSVSGSVEGGLTDSDFANGATLTSVGTDPIYEGLVDGSSALELLTGGFSTSVGFGSTTIGPVNGAAGGPAIAMTDLGIVITFTLTNGDSANFTADFTIDGTKVPAPSALALLGLAGIAGTRRRRR
jgi:MYXO-CTERM domain-containing protein